MKKSIIIFCTVLITLCFSFYGFINLNETETASIETAIKKEISSTAPTYKKNKKSSDFIFEVGPRFRPIKKGTIEKAKTISDFIPEDQIQQIEVLKSVSVIIFKSEEQSDIREKGISNEFTLAQLKLLQSFDYSTNFLIKVEYLQKNNETGTLETSYSTPHHTIVPEKQAVFIDGKEAIKGYLNLYSEEARKNVDPKKLKPAKLFFTVTKKGTIENIYLDRSSYYPEVDEVMIKLLSEVPGTWIPAENSKGEKVAQELVVSFGLMGC